MAGDNYESVSCKLQEGNFYTDGLVPPLIVTTAYLSHLGPTFSVLAAP